MGRLLRSRVFVGVIALLVGASVASGLAWASIPNSTSGVITACYSKTLATKTLRVIDVQAGQRCSSSENTLSWQAHGETAAQVSALVSAQMLAAAKCTRGTEAGTIVVAAVDPHTGIATSTCSVPHIYWVNRNAGTVVEANLDGTDPQTIATGQSGPEGVAVSTGHLYWTNDTAGTVVEANLDGTSPQTIATGQNGPEGVAVSADQLYWADQNGGTVVEANLDGTSPQTIATGQNGPVGVALSASQLYWTNFAAGTVVEANLDGTSPQTIASSQNHPEGSAVGGRIPRIQLSRSVRLVIVRPQPLRFA